MTRDLRLLPAAVLGWCACLTATRLRPEGVAVLVLAGLAVVVAATARLRTPQRGRHRRAAPGRAAASLLLTAVVVTAALAWAGARSELRRATVEPLLRTSVVATLRIDGEPRRVGHDTLLVRATLAAVEGGTARGVPVLVLADGSWWEVVVGSRVQARARVAPTAPGDPAGALLVPHEPPVLLARAPPLAAGVARLRAGLLRAVEGLDPQARGLVPGIALGDDRALPVALAEDLRTVSLTHVTAVSGAHVAMVLGLVMATLVRLPRPWRAGVAGVVLVGLVLLVHPSASVLRSAAMGAVLLLGLLLARPRAALPALWTSVLVLLAVDPWLASSFGFVLSVLATAGLLLGSGPLAAWLSRALPRPLAVALAVPLAAQLACLPALALLQPRMPVHAVLANTLAAPAVPPATVLGLAATLVAPVSASAAASLAGLAGVATAWVAAVATWCARLPLATLPWWVAVVAGVVLVAVLVRRRPMSRSAS